MRDSRIGANAVTPPPATLADLRAALLRYRADCEAANRGAMFNEGLPEPVKRPKHPQNPERGLAIRQALGGAIGDAWWALCCTGMLPDEFFSGKWAVEDGRVHVKGTKREARDRCVPLLRELQPSTMTKQQFERAVRESGLGVRPKDGRDSLV